ncbi:MAG: NTP transferase domain-containing protein [Phycisphaerales bacterium]|nr:NTP transferase domain-containing protein [Phycisphaerales bacterium]
MWIDAIVQARLTSRRLPGKVLRPLHGRPMLTYLLERLERCRRLRSIIVATSADASDDPIASFCAGRGVPCVRGPLEDVAGRFGAVLDAFEPDAFVRVCADSPLLDPALVDHAAARYRATIADVVSNVVGRTYPSGQSVEVVGVSAFRDACARMTEPFDREHVTPYLYRHADRYRIHGFRSSRPMGNVGLAVDTEADLASVTAILAAMERPHWDYGLDQLLTLHTRTASTPAAIAV